MADFTIKRNDLLPKLEAILKDGNNDPVDLTAATDIVFHMRFEKESTLKIQDGEVDIDLDPTTGKVSYEWQGGTTSDTDTEGIFLGEFSVTWTGGKEQTFPSAGYINIEIYEDLA